MDVLASPFGFVLIFLFCFSLASAPCTLMKKRRVPRRVRNFLFVLGFMIIVRCDKISIATTCGIGSSTWVFFFFFPWFLVYFQSRFTL